MEYMNAAGRVPLLTAEEEIILGRKVQDMQQLLEAKPQGPYSSAERRMMHRGRRARDRMVTANMRMVVVISKQYCRRCDHLSQEDLMQEGTFGLIRAVEKFDPERGYKFSTYAYWWIRQAMNRAVTAYDRAIRLPAHVAERSVKLRAWISSRMELHGTPTLDECAAFLEVDRETARTYLQHLHGALSLDSKVKGTETESSSLVDTIADNGATPWENLEENDTHRITLLRHELKKLPDQEKEIIQLRFFGDFFNVSTRSVSAKLGISRQGVAHREEKIIRKLRLKLSRVAA